MDISLKYLEIFHSVVVTGSITKASQRVGLSQPTISQQLSRLEEVLKVQLIIRNRSGQIAMTPAGEFWFRASEEMLCRMHATVSEHRERFSQSNLLIRLGVTPALRGTFTSAAARIAQEETAFAKFELVYALNSLELAEMLRLHQIDLAIVAARSISSDLNSFACSELYEDRMLWAVPASVSEDDIRAALRNPQNPGDLNPLLRQYVEIDAAVPTRGSSDDWYRNYLPFARPAFSAQTFASSVELVAEGLGTCHTPRSLMPNLGQRTLGKIRVYELPLRRDTAVLAMRKHLLSHPSYAQLFHGITEFCHSRYETEMAQIEASSFADMMDKDTRMPPPATRLSGRSDRAVTPQQSGRRKPAAVGAGDL